MRIKALVSFAGAFSMGRGEVRECSDKAILQDLLRAKYVEEVNEPEAVEEKPKKDVTLNDDKQSKRNNKSRAI